MAHSITPPPISEELVIQDLAFKMIREAIGVQRKSLSTHAGINADTIDAASQVVTTAIHILAYFQTGACPTCPYLDSLEEDEPDCECEEPFQWPGAQLADARTLRVVDFAAPNYSEDLGTYLIFCKNQE